MRYILIILLLSTAAGQADERRVTLSAPEALVETGIFKHLLPRFKFKTQVVVELAKTGEIAIVEGAAPTVFVWQGRSFGLAPARPEGHGKRFADWLRSDVGQNTLTSFRLDGETPFQRAGVAGPAPVATAVSGDVLEGEKLAHFHCGRCHVVSERNRMGGIGSTPSFGAMKNFPDWEDKFLAFYTLNPHPAFTQIEGLTNPFDPSLPPAIAPVEMSETDYEAIIAYVRVLPVKDLGSAIISQ